MTDSARPFRARRRGPAGRNLASASAEAAGAPDTMRLGLRLRHARLTKGLSLREVADLVDCSESFISKLENGRTRPSLTLLHRLVATLEINVAALFADGPAEGGPVAIVRRDKRPVIAVDRVWKGEGIHLERLIPNARGVLLQANIHDVAPGGSSDGFIQHEGEEIGYILEGRITLTVDGESYDLGKGDSFFFPSHLPHGYRNPGKTRARVLWVNTPASF